MEKPYYFSPKYPPRHPVMEQAMGRFMIEWAVLESQLDSGIAAVLCTDPTLALTITANAGTKSKLDILHSAISMSHELLDDGVCERAHSTLNRIADLSGKHRNTLAHGGALNIERGWWWSRVSARQSLDVKVYQAPATRWKKAATEVRKVTREWCRVYQEIWHALDEFSYEEREAAYHYTIKSE